MKDLYGNALKENQRLKQLIDEQQVLLDEKNLIINQLETKVNESSEVVVINNAWNLCDVMNIFKNGLKNIH